jgi:hypothetical protein
MKKITKLLLVLPILFMLTGCTNPMQKKETENTATKREQQQEKKDLSFKNVFSQGEAYRCNYEDENGEVTAWVKGDKVKVEGIAFGAEEEDRGAMINDGQWVYIWNEGTMEGMKYDLAVMQQMGEAEIEEGEETADGSEYQDPQEWAAEVEQDYEVDCQATVISDSEFQAPENVEFKDLTQMYQKAKEIQESMGSPNPNGQGQMSGEDTQKKIDELKQMVEDFDK